MEFAILNLIVGFAAGWAIRHMNESKGTAQARADSLTADVKLMEAEESQKRAWEKYWEVYHRETEHLDEKGELNLRIRELEKEIEKLKRND